MDRDRPFAHRRNAVVLVDPTTDLSSSSDHSTIATAAAGLWCTRRPFQIMATVLAATRVEVGAHYP